MKLRGLYIVAIAISALFASSCSKNAEQVAAMETADQIEARNAGRDAAKAIITKEWKDTMELQQKVLEARAANSKYEMEGNPAAKAAFDSAFYGTIQSVRPDLAEALKGR
ncbi:MAG: hypothetical protein J1E97_05960 [Muribaculaceae bacterium]|nr:hypothetical protein [Muribaculaceae bacterium]